MNDDPGTGPCGCAVCEGLCPNLAPADYAYAGSDRIVIADGDIDAIEEFAEDARQAMKARLFDGLRRGWGLGFRTDYPDGRVFDRLDQAVEHLKAAVEHYHVTRDHAEVAKRAADVANQAFMAADLGRLTNNE